MIENLKLLASHTPQESITIRLPLIPNYNDQEKLKANLKELKGMGFKNFDTFNYITYEHNKDNRNGKHANDE